MREQAGFVRQLGVSEIINANLGDEVKQGPSHPCGSHLSYPQPPITSTAN